MQAGFALVETGFCRKKHAAHVMSTNFAIFGLGFVGFFFVGFPLAFGGFSYAGSFGLDAAGRRRADRQRELGVPLAGRLGAERPRHRREGGTGRRVLLLHGRLHGHDGDDPDRRDGRAVEVERVRRLGPLLRCASTTRCSRRGRGAAAGWPSSATSAELGFGYVDFAGSGVVHAVGGVAALAGAHRPRASHRQVRQGRQAARDARAQHPDGACSACSSCCSAGSASTPRRRSRRPTSGSRSRPRTPRSRPRSVPRSRCSTSCGGSASPTRA